MDLNSLVDPLLPDRKIYLKGFADMAGLLSGKYAGYGYAVSLARRLDDRIIDAIKTGPTPEYLEHYRQINTELAGVVAGISKWLTEKGVENLPIQPTMSENETTPDYEKTLRWGFSHKMAATRAGLGWIGKTDLLITKKFGPRVRLATVLVKDKIAGPARPIDKSRCGKCVICVEACPAGAANGKPWNTETDRDVFYDAFKCRQKCRELSLKNMNERITICGICVSVCPKGLKTYP